MTYEAEQWRHWTDFINHYLMRISFKGVLTIVSPGWLAH